MPDKNFDKQRFWYNFSGEALDTNIWHEATGTGSPTYQMANVVDGGFEIITGTTAGNHGFLSFNDTARFLDEDASVIIGTIQAVSSADDRTVVGGVNNVAFTNHWCFVGLETNNNDTNFNISTNGGSTTNTSTGVAKNANFNAFKITMNPADIDVSVNGGTATNVTLNLPTLPLQPFFFQDTRTSSAKTGRIKYYEAYGT